MLTTNVDISDRLINGQLGYIYDFATNIGTVTKIYIKFDDNAAGLKAIQNNLWQEHIMLSQLVEQRHHLHCQKPIHLQSNKLSFLLCWNMPAPCAKFKVLL